VALIVSKRRSFRSRSETIRWGFGIAEGIRATTNVAEARAIKGRKIGIASNYRVHLVFGKRLDRHRGAGHQEHKTQHERNLPHVILLNEDRCRWMTAEWKIVASE
jgi:hypothetical protein